LLPAALREVPIGTRATCRPAPLTTLTAVVSVAKSRSRGMIPIASATGSDNRVHTLALAPRGGSAIDMTNGRSIADHVSRLALEIIARRPV
jgi:hypothetical protein